MKKKSSCTILEKMCNSNKKRSELHISWKNIKYQVKTIRGAQFLRKRNATRFEIANSTSFE
jgi:hypothetical protein